MRLLVSWLREFVDVPGSPEDLARTMSVRGFAVEGIEHVSTDLSAEAVHPKDGPPSQHWPVGSHSDPTIAKADAVLDFEVTANRPDCMSVVGMAREIATAYNLPLRAAGRPAAELQAAGRPAAEPALRTSDDRRAGAAAGGPAEVSAEVNAGIDIVIERADLCPRYAGAVADVIAGPSPGWMQARLQAAGVRPISNIVDVTNYVLLELGQPMHAFDLAKLSGAQIRVRTARPGETLRTLDGRDRGLSPDMLVIADAERATAIAGVMGGAHSEVTRETKAIVLESACFNPLSVRRTSRTLELKTEASMRFERGADPGLPVTAMARATALLEAIGAGRARGTIIDRCPARVERRVLRLRRARIAGVLGAAIPDADVRRILDGLGCTLGDAMDGWDVHVPSRRVDVSREIDLIEEVARHYGFDRLPVTFPPLTAAPRPLDPRIQRTRQLRASLTAAGFSEAMTFGFVAAAAAAPFAAEGDIVPIANPLSETFAVLRPSALPALIGAVAHNRRRERRDVRLFEIGARFSRASGERRALACAWTGLAASEHWSGSGRDVDFFDMKAVVARVCEVAGVAAETTPHHERWLVPGRSAAVTANGTHIAMLGQLTRDITDAHGMPADPVYVADIDLDALDQAGAGRRVRVESLPRYPSVTRDISVLVDDTLAAADVRRTIRDAAPPTLVHVVEFDRYQGKGIPDRHVSLSLHLAFRSPERTLTDAEVQTAMDQVLAALKEKHGAVQR